MKTISKITYPALTLFAFPCFALSPAAQAVDPPPDGGYPHRNTADGEDALFSLTTGGSNTATGFQALFSNTGGGGNTATGESALYSNQIGGSNTAIGFEALYNNISSHNNTAIMRRSGTTLRVTPKRLLGLTHSFSI
jgi:hypothetical protein